MFLRTSQIALAMAAFAAGVLAIEDASAELDALEVALADSQAPVVYWENVRSDSPLWAGGIAPGAGDANRGAFEKAAAWFDLAGAQSVVLRPGEQTVVLVPRGERLRIHHPKRTWTPGDVSIWVSNGSGLYVEQTAIATDDGHSLVATPKGNGPFLVRVQRPENCGEPLAAALYVSRREPLGQLVSYRDLVRFDSAPAGCSLVAAHLETNKRKRLAEQPVWRVSPENPACARGSGPARFVFEHRRCYNAADAARVQEYRIVVRLDGNECATFDCETRPETRNLVIIANETPVLGTIEKVYFDVPEGPHEIAIASDAVLSGQLRKLPDRDYLIPALNEPKPNANDACAMISAAASKWVWDVAPRETAAALENTGRPPIETERAAAKLAHDNRRREGGLLAAMMMDDAAARRPELPELREAAESLFLEGTFYRDLFPNAKPDSSALAFSWTTARRLREPDERGRDIVAASQHARESAGLLPGGFHVEIPPAGAAAPIEYALPTRTAASELRVIAADDSSGGAQRFALQLDDAPPMQFALDTANLPAPEAYWPSLSETGLEQLRHAFGLTRNVTLSGPFSETQEPAPMRLAGIWELPLPGNVRSIKAWRCAPNAGALTLALQYRASRPYQLSEVAFLDALDALSSPEAAGDLLVRALQGQQPDEALPHAENELLSHWLPLVRQLKSLDTTFLETVSRAPLRPTEAPLLEKIGATEKAADAVAAERRGDCVTALETWAALLDGAPTSLRLDALSGLARSLDALGETYLAGRLLRWRFLHDSSSQVRELARGLLEDRVGRAKDIEGLLEIRAVTALREPVPARIAALVETLIANGEYEMGLTAGLALPSDAQPLDVMARAAYVCAWFRTLDEISGRLGDPAARKFWQGIRECEMGRYEEATAILSDAGARGADYARAREWGRAIAQRLASASPEERERGIAEWEAWEAAHPGPRYWRDFAACVTDYAGAETTYSIERGVFGRAFRAEPGRPVRLRFAGPARLRIEARPLLEKGLAMPVDGWVRIEEQDVLRLVPYTNNLPSEGMDLIGSPWAAGMRVGGDYEFGPGLHDLSVYSPGRPITIEVSVEVPEIPLGVLPRLNIETLWHAWNGGYTPSPALQVQPDYNLVVLNNAPPSQESPTNGSFTVYPFALDAPRAFSAAASPNAMQLAAMFARLETARGASAEVSAETIEGRLLAADDWRGALALPLSDTDAGILHRMTDIVWAAEQHPDEEPELLVRAEALAQAHPDVPGLQALLSRVTSGADWELAENVSGGLGLKRIEVTGWNPETPALRVRKALLGIVPDGAHVLSGYQDLVLVFGNPDPAAVVMDVTLAYPEFLEAGPVTVNCELDDRPIERLPLAADKRSAHVSFSIPAGDHALRVRIEEPLANEYVIVRLAERLPDGEVPLVRAIERVYYAATAESPLHVRVEGPAWIRVDEPRETVTRSTYRAIEAGLHEFELTPAPGCAEALFRVHRRAIAPEKRTPPVWRVTLARKPVPPPDTQLASAPRDDTADTEQPDTLLRRAGVRTVRQSIERRLGYEQDETGNQPAQVFIEFGAEHRRYARDERFHFDTDLLLRERTTGGPTLGLRERVSFYPEDSPSSAFIEASAFVQTPEAHLGGGTEWALSLNGQFQRRFDVGAKAFHLPYLSLFLRGMSMDTNALDTPYWQRQLYRQARNAVTGAIAGLDPLGSAPELAPINDFFTLLARKRAGALMDNAYGEYLNRTRYDVRALDRDIFSSYKAAHRGGFRIGDTITYRPWLDTEWYAGAYLTSNEDFNPFGLDHFGLRGGWRQLIGNVEVSAEYSFKRYLDDGDRSGAIDRRYVNVEALWDHWINNQRRIEVGLSLIGDLDRKDVEGTLRCSLHFGNDKAYRAFRPGEIDFKDVRIRRAANATAQEDTP